jgi:hypothetical protein
MRGGIQDGAAELYHQVLPSRTRAQQANLYPDNLSNYFKLEPGHAYTVVIRRSRGLPTVDELGRPLKEVEVRCSFDVPDYGIPRVTHPR